MWRTRAVGQALLAQVEAVGAVEIAGRAAGLASRGIDAAPSHPATGAAVAIEWRRSVAGHGLSSALAPGLSRHDGAVHRDLHDQTLGST